MNTTTPDEFLKSYNKTKEKQDHKSSQRNEANHLQKKLT
jgi:hypothetical protein